MYILGSVLFLQLLLATPGSLTVLPCNLQTSDQVAKIDRQIATLKDLQEKYEANAQRNINNAMRWQFQRENYLDARKAWDEVARDKQVIKELQEQIDILEKKKQSILQGS